MNERAAAPSPRTLAAQARARDPDRSVWVRANAGAGKTHVLTERVLRLLLDGAAPESLLCLTYTKAAAAEMRARVSARLAGWAVAEGPALDKMLTAILDRVPFKAETDRARTLFARALETPGGLKINTIHAFAESLLHRFPLEAGVPFDFEVIADSDRAAMIAQARARAIAGAIEGTNGLGAALDTLFAALSDSQIEAAVGEGLGNMRQLMPVLADPVAAKDRLGRAFGVAPDDEVATVRAGIVRDALFPPADYRERLAALARKDWTGFEQGLADIDPADPDPDRILALFLKKDGTVPARFPPAKLKKADPGLADLLVAEAERLAGVVDRIKRVGIVRRSEALIDLLAGIADDYAAQKRAGALLDFDDLIARTVALLGDTAQSAWVRYKLDAGIDHILVDESQDTNAEQWQVVDALAEDFFAGEGAVGRPRSVFAVGDPKQSIFSFQGAAPALFLETGDRFAERARAVGRTFEQVPLTASFRTLAGILSLVDTVFATDERARALLSGSEPVTHDSARRDAGGRVFVWPKAEADEVAVADAVWPLPSEAGSGRSAARVLADTIGDTIALWLDEKRPLGPRGRAIRADDILILVQTRNLLFQEIVRALKTRNIASPGADRLAVGSHIAVLDLLTLGDVVLNPHDDLGLAALLRSPLFDFSEDDLFVLAQPRGAAGLYAALMQSDMAVAKGAYRMLSDWRSRLDVERPFEFFSHVLYAGGGLKRFHTRLGPEVDDVLSEFLDLALIHEQTGQPGLQGFLVQMRARDAEIKRELSDSGTGVRVMTVHGAKGLEAPVVILAGASQAPGGPQSQPKLYFSHWEDGPFLSHAPARAEDCAPTAALRADAQAAERAEYWRRLYVAMTRAEDELHVTGLAAGKATAETWYDAVTNAIADTGAPEALTPALTATAYPAEAPASVQPRASERVAPEPPVPLVVDPVPAPRPVRIVQPSLAGAAAAPDAGFAPIADAIRDAGAAKRRGLAVHALLQHLPGVPGPERERVAAAAVRVLLPETPDDWAGIAAQALELLSRTDLAHLFGPQSRAEVPVLAQGEDGQGAIRLVGRIDRLAIGKNKVLVVDYKSDAQPPASVADVPASYTVQLGLYRAALAPLYPDREIVTAILWTETGVLMDLPTDAPVLAGAAFGAAGQT